MTSGCRGEVEEHEEVLSALLEPVTSYASTTARTQHRHQSYVCYCSRSQSSGM